MDLIHICEHKLSMLEIDVRKRYLVGETDLWVPALSLGIEIRNSWQSEDETLLIRTLSDTNFRLQARHLVVVVPDDFSDQTFESLRKIEKRNVFDNLSTIRVGDFGNYLIKVKEIENNSS